MARGLSAARTGPEVRAKAKDALRMRREGLKLREIGDALGGLSRERARQLVLVGKQLERTQNRKAAASKK
ncbi:MAG: hypothetical protein WBD55_09530 [Dehalococcoidia bacterium]